MMYVNLIWAWGHPEVYILVLPAFGIFSEVVATFSRKRLFGYASMVGAIWAIVVLSFGVWLHHFFTMGAGADVNAVFGIATMLIAIPTGVKIFNWLFTMYRGRIRFGSHDDLVYGLCLPLYHGRCGRGADGGAASRLSGAQQPVFSGSFSYHDCQRRAVWLFCRTYLLVAENFWL